MTIVIFILVLGVLVLVQEFGFGFPPRVLGKKFGETLYSINLFPLGGFVRIFGEQGEGENDAASFVSHPIWQRIVIIAAGVFMNVVLAWVLFSLGHVIGMPSVGGDNLVVENPQITIIGIAAGSPAENAELTFGNVIKKIEAGGATLEPQNTDELIQFVNAHKGEALSLEIQSSAAGEEAKTITVVSRASPPSGEGPLGIALADIGIAKSPWYLAPWRGLQSLWFSVQATFGAFVGLFQSAVQHGKIPEGVSGPLGLFVLTGQAERLGISYFIQFIALLSVNLAILNAVPFPALDGGRILFLAIEKIRGRPVHISYERATHAIGFVLLLALILVISYRDVQRFFF